MATAITKSYSVGDTVYVKVPYTNLVGWIAIEKIVSLISFTGAGNLCTVTFTDNSTVTDSTATPTVFTTAKLCDTAIVNDVVSKAEAAVVEEAAVTSTLSAVAQAETLTLSGCTAGTITLKVNGTNYSQAFSGTIDNTTDAFNSFNAADLATAGVTLTHPSTSALRFVSATAGIPFTIVQIDAGNVAQEVIYTLSGISGSVIQFIINSNPLSEAFDTNSATTATNFFTSFAASLLASDGIVLTNPSSGALKFKANVAGVAMPNILANSAGTGGTWTQSGVVANSSGTWTRSSITANTRAVTGGITTTKIERSY